MALERYVSSRTGRDSEGKYFVDAQVTSGTIDASGRLQANLTMAIDWDPWMDDGPDYVFSRHASVELGSEGEITSFQITSDGNPESVEVRFTYAADLVAEPTGPDVVKYNRFMLAKEAPNIVDTLDGLAIATRAKVTPTTPASLRAEAKKQVKQAYRYHGLRTRVKVIDVKRGVRFQATNLFTKQTCAVDLTARAPNRVADLEISDAFQVSKAGSGVCLPSDWPPSMR